LIHFSSFLGQSQGEEYDDGEEEFDDESSNLVDIKRFNKYEDVNNKPLEYDSHDDGEGILSSNENDLDLKKPKNYENVENRQMDSIDKYLLKNNLNAKSGNKNAYPYNDEFGRKIRQPRTTYEVLLERVGFKKMHMQVDQANKDFEEKKRALVGKDLTYSENEWKEILKKDNRNKLYETSNKRIKESLTKGIPEGQRGKIWCFLCQANKHKESFNLSKPKLFKFQTFMPN
jgi:hypothetical protein